MKKSRWVVRSALVVSLLGLSLHSTVPAQETQSQTPNVSDQELKTFAKAYIEVDKIRLAYEPSLLNARDAEHAKSIRQEAAAEMEKAVEEQGFTGETYVRIFNTIKDDAELRGKTARMILEEQKNRWRPGRFHHE